MRAVVTGGGGFIGSHMVDRLLAQDANVLCVDNFSTGNIRFLDQARESSKLEILRFDLKEQIDPAIFDGVDIVYHFAANADVRHGLSHPYRDLEENARATLNVLEGMRASGCKRIVFSSTGAIYGDHPRVPTPEGCEFPAQTSLYGVSKLAAEGAMSTYSNAFGFEATVFRFVSILGSRYTHGHLYDFTRQLLKNPSNLYVLGDGKQIKSYLHVQDCIDAILFVTRERRAGFHVFNLGHPSCSDVDFSISMLREFFGADFSVQYSGGSRGWVGDNPNLRLDISKVSSFGWSPSRSIADSIRDTIRYLTDNRWVFDERG